MLRASLVITNVYIRYGYMNTLNIDFIAAGNVLNFIVRIFN